MELPRGPSGSRRRVLRRVRTKAEAVRVLRMLRSEFDDHGVVANGRRKVSDAVAVYSEQLAGSDRKSSTAASHEWMLGLIVDGLGWKKLADLTVAECDGFLEQAANGLRPGARAIGPDHLRRLRAMLVAVIRNEVRLGTVSRNVADLSRRPASSSRRHRKGKRRALTRGELRALIEVATGVDLVAVDLMGRNGLRPAEARALTWASVDLEKQLLSIDAQMEEGDDPDDVKTDESLRMIRLDGITVTRLSEWYVTQARSQHRTSERWTDLDLVVSTRYGTPINRNNLLRSVKRLCEKAELASPIVPYELRHTAISHQADAGRSSWDIADWAGTSQRMIAETYRHQLREISSLTPADESE